MSLRVQTPTCYDDTQESSNHLAFLEFRKIEEDGRGIAHYFFDEGIEKGKVGLGVVGWWDLVLGLRA